NVAVVARVMHGGQHEAIDEYRTAFLVDFVFDGIRIHRDFDDDVEFFRRFLACGYSIETHLNDNLGIWEKISTCANRTTACRMSARHRRREWGRCRSNRRRCRLRASALPAPAWPRCPFPRAGPRRTPYGRQRQQLVRPSVRLRFL